MPFCFHKCHYCDFYSITRQTPERMEAYVDRILREADAWTNAVTGPTPQPRTIFFGGGTPTLLPIHTFHRLIAGLRRRIDLSLVDEWTVEANPATVTAEYCAMLKANGVTRLSFGAQSFDRADLAILERHHNPDDVAHSIALARSAGLNRLNVDLIFAIPGQTLVSWQHSLQQAIALGTTHLSCYGLTYEPNTAMAVRKRLGHFQGADESLELLMMRHTRNRLATLGLPAYEISNYATAGQECRHNLLYWTGGDYLGLGPSAASHVQGWRWKNKPHLGEWERSIDTGQLPATEVEHLTPTRRHGELAMLMLRLTAGLVFADFTARTGHDARNLFAAPIARYLRTGLLQIDAAALRLTDAGLPVADAIAAEFLVPQAIT